MVEIWRKITIAVVCLSGLGTSLFGAPLQMHWSPDGSKAAWSDGTNAWVLDENGKVLSDLGPAAGFAWSSDGHILYYAAPVKHPADSTPAATTTSTTSPIAPPAPTWVLMQYAQQAGEAQVPFGQDPIVSMNLSPEDRFLGVVVAHGPEPTFQGYLVSPEQAGQSAILPSQTTRLIGFTAPHRVVYVRVDSSTGVPGRGVLVEGVIGEGSNVTKEIDLLDVVADDTRCIVADGEDLLFTSVPMVLPAPLPRRSREETKCHTLYHFTRANRGLSPIVEHVGPYFALSPDRQHILIEQITPPTDQMPERRELVLMNVNGSDPHLVCDLTSYPELPMWPAWRSANEFAFVAPIDPELPPAKNEDGTLRHEVVLYRTDGEGNVTIHPIRTLSEGWPDAMKPTSKTAEATTQPSSQPTTKPAARESGKAD